MAVDQSDRKALEISGSERTDSLKQGRVCKHERSRVPPGGKGKRTRDRLSKGF